MGGVILMNYALSSSLVDFLEGGADSGLLVSGVAVDGCIGLLELSLQSGIEGPVLQGLRGDDLNALFCGFDVWQS